MRNAVCSHCQQAFVAPDDLPQVTCVRCGRPVPPNEPAVTSETSAAVSQAIRPAAEVEWSPPRSELPPEPRTQAYADWDDFRSNAPTVQQTLLDLATRALPDMRNVPLLPLPPDTPTETDALGEPIASVEVAGENRILHLLVCLALVLASAVFPYAMLFGLGGDKRAPMTLGAGLLVGLMSLSGFGYAVWIYLQGPKLPITLWILEGGILWQQGSDIDACNWEAIHELKIGPDGGGLLCTLGLRSDLQVVISPRQTPALMPVLEFIEAKATAAQLLPRLRRVTAGERVLFGRVELSRTGLGTAEFFAPWSETTKVVSDDHFLLVDCRHFSSWRKIRYLDVSFAQLAMRIAHVLIEEQNWLPAVKAG